MRTPFCPLRSELVVISPGGFETRSSARRPDDSPRVVISPAGLCNLAGRPYWWARCVISPGGFGTPQRCRDRSARPSSSSASGGFESFRRAVLPTESPWSSSAQQGSKRTGVRLDVHAMPVVISPGGSKLVRAAGGHVLAHRRRQSRRVRNEWRPPWKKSAPGSSSPGRVRNVGLRYQARASSNITCRHQPRSV